MTRSRNWRPVPIGSEDKSFIRDFFAFYKEILCSDCGISHGKIVLAKVEGGIVNLSQSSGDEAMNTSPCVLSAGLYKGHRFPAEIISHCVWLYFRFCLSYRDVEEMMVERGIAVSYESVREWCLKFGGAYAKRIRSRGARPGDRCGACGASSDRDMPSDSYRSSGDRIVFPSWPPSTGGCELPRESTPRTRRVGLSFRKPEDPRGERQLLEALDQTETQDNSPRLGEFSGEAAHPLVSDARIGGGSKDRSRPARAFCGRKSQRLQQNLA
jgi:hypothetical protein